MKEIKFLGIGSAFNVKLGNTSMYVKQDNVLLLIDCGESIFEKILEHNILNNITDVNVLITHLHSDHIGSLSSLIFYCYYKLNIVPNIYFDDKEQLYDILKLMGTKINEHYKLYSTKSCHIDFIDIISLKTDHVKGMNCYSYILNINDKKIFYSGDSTSLSFYKTYNIIKNNIICFQEVCLPDYKGNVHTSIKKLKENIPISYRENIYCMHIDCDEVIEELYKEGFNVVNINKNYFEE